MNISLYGFWDLNNIPTDNEVKTIFISHPFSDNPKEYREKVEKICKDIIKNNPSKEEATENNPVILPISPLHLFSFMEEDGDYREKIMEVCYFLIWFTDETWIYIYGLNKSTGQVKENNYALEIDKNVVFKRGD